MIEIAFEGSEQVYFPTKNGNHLFVPFPCKDFHSCYPFLIKFPPGRYVVELFGASGGGDYSHDSLKPGQGGKTEGYYIVTKLFENFYLFLKIEFEFSKFLLP